MTGEYGKSMLGKLFGLMPGAPIFAAGLFLHLRIKNQKNLKKREKMFPYRIVDFFIPATARTDF
jgi:hypothetical protein